MIATTNHPQLLDSALWRRFDEIVAFEPPELQLAGFMDRLNACAAGTALDLGL